MRQRNKQHNTSRSLPNREGGGRVLPSYSREGGGRVLRVPGGGRALPSYRESGASFLHALIAQGEHQQQDFKYKISDAAKLARSVSAFANTDGGRLLIGVRDDGRIHGVQSEEEVYMMEAAANRYCQPDSPIHFEGVQAEGHNVVIATIPPATTKPVFALEPADDSKQQPTPYPSLGRGELPHKSLSARTSSPPQGGAGGGLSSHGPSGGGLFSLRPTAYVRVGDQNIVASPVHLALWRQQQQPFGTTLHFTEAEQQLLSLLNAESGITLNRLTRLSRLPRKRVTDLLARFVRYGIAYIYYDEGNWRFRS